MRSDGVAGRTQAGGRSLGTESTPKAGAGDWSFADRLGDMISAHAPDGTYRYASAAARDLLGYEPSELVGTWAYDYFHPDDVSKVSVAHRSALGGAPFTVSYRLRHKNDEYLWVETTNQIVTVPGGDEVVEILCCTRAVAHREPSTTPVEDEEHQACRRRVHSVLESEAVTPFFQPIVELASGQRIAYEALARFPGNPSHTPDRWFADAWSVGLGIPLELLATKVAAAALPKLPAGTGLSINASPPAIAARGFLGCLGNSVGRVAVEDFGAGYASLRHVLSMRPEWIKLDISLTERIDRDPVATALAAAMVSFADRIDATLVAEGIESAEQAQAVSTLGIRFGQGYFFGRPAPLDEALASA